MESKPAPGTEGGGRIKVVGVGGGGGNAVQAMCKAGLQGVQFVCANTDLQSLARNVAPVKVALGERLTRGMGTNGNPAKGREAALESVDAIRMAIRDAQTVVVTAGMGGGTGTGAAPVVAKLAREQGALTMGVVTRPFGFEGEKRRRLAELGIEEFGANVDGLIVIPNDRMLDFAGRKTSFARMLEMVDDALFHAVKGLTDVIAGDDMFHAGYAAVRLASAPSEETGVGESLPEAGQYRFGSVM
jgi:cell division protein FtsZ